MSVKISELPTLTAITADDYIPVTDAGPLVTKKITHGNLMASLATGSTTQRLLADRFAEVINVKDYGAVGDGATDDTAAITAAFNALNAAGSLALKKLVFPAGGQYVLTGALPAITVSNWIMEAYGSRILMNGTGAYTAIQFGYNNPTTNRISGATVRGLTLIKNNATGGTGLKCVGWSSYSSLQDIVIFMGYHGTNGDKGFYFVGTNETAIHNLSVVADKPIVLGNATGTAGDGFDHINFNNIDLYSTTNSNPLITVENGTSWGTVSFTGNQIWVGGNAGFYYNDPGATSNNGNIAFENIRRENNTVAAPPNASGYSIDIQMPTGKSAQLVSVRSSQFTYGTVVNGTAMHGIRLHSDAVRLLVDSYFDGGGTGQTVLEITGTNNTVDDITLRNFNPGGGTVSFTNTKTTENLHFETKSWTPTIGGTATYSLQSGKYTKIGSVVTAQCQLTINTVGTGSPVTISGLPLANGANSAIGSGWWASSATNIVTLVPYLAPGGTSISLYSLTAAGATLVNTNNIFQNGTTVYVTITYQV